MATYTEKLNLKLPDYTDPADVQDLNENFQKIDAYASQTGGKVSSVTVNGTKHEPDSKGNVDLGTIQGGIGGAQYINELLPDPNEESVEEDNVVLPVKADDSDKLGGKAPEYYAKQETVDQLSEQIAEKLSMELLWENASPTSAFEAKTITPGVAIPEVYMIVFRITAAGSARTVGPICVGKSVGYYAYSTNYAGMLASRQFVVNASSIQFFAGQISSEYGTLTENNNYMIPLYIYGIKGVK